MVSRGQRFSEAVLSPRGITWGSMVVNVLLTVSKVAAGFLCRSQTILADGLHSGSDLVTDIAVLAGLQVSQRPADPAHPYGHRRVSTLVALFVGAALAGAAAWIAYDGIQALHNYLHHHTASNIQAGLPFWLALATFPIKEFAYRITRYVGKKHGDVSVVANAWHHRTDAFAGLAAAVGLGGVLLGGADWRYLDPLTAIVLSAFLVVASVKIVSANASELIDRAPAGSVLADIEKAVGDTPGVQSYHAFRARQTGGKIIMDIHVQVDPGLTVRQGHNIARSVRDSVIGATSDVLEVIVHVEPRESQDSPRPSRA